VSGMLLHLTDGLSPGQLLAVGGGCAVAGYLLAIYLLLRAGR